ncbi:MAG: MobV family relaxase [Bacteroidota bacterium]
MEQFAVFRITKFKKIGGIGAHIDRRHISSNVQKAKTELNEELAGTLGMTIDASKSHLKEEWVTSQKGDLSKDVEARIAAGYRLSKTIRHDAVRAVGVIMTGSHTRMKEIEADPKLFDAWKKANYRFACHEFGEQNIVRFTLHRDEKTPHFHCVFVPITPKGGLSAKHFTGGSSQLRAYQDRYAEAMKPFGLARGIPKELTRREHIPTEDYYREVERLAAETKKATQGIKASNIFQLDNVRDQLSERITGLTTSTLYQQKQAAYVNITNESLMNEAQRAAYKARLREESQAAINEVKQEINLIDFACHRLGWQLNKKKTSRRHAVLRHERHGVIIAPTSPVSPSGDWVFSWADKDGGGTLIDLLQQEGWNWKEIRALAGETIALKPVTALPVSYTHFERQKEQDPQKQTALAEAQFRALQPGEGASYLERRQINKKFYKNAPQVRMNSHEAIFKLYKVLEGRAHLCSTIKYSFDNAGNSRKYFQKGLPRGLSVLREPGPVERLIVSESPVDALSWRQVEALQGEKNAPGTMCVCTCGSLKSDIKSYVRHLFKEAHKKGQSVVIARDNDRAGQRISHILSGIAQEEGLVPLVSVPPKGKDWNDYLALVRANEKLLEVKSAPPPRKSPAYKDTLLEELSITENACKGLKGYKAGAKELVFPLYTSGQDVQARQSVGQYQLRREEDGLHSHYEAQGTTPGLVVLPAEKPTQSVVITSNPLDIFLHRSAQQRTDITYISTCGQKEIKAPLSAILSTYKDAPVLLYMHEEEALPLQKQLMGEIDCSVHPPQQAFWHHAIEGFSYDLQKAMQADYEEWEPVKPKKRRKGTGKRLKAA